MGELSAETFGLALGCSWECRDGFGSAETGFALVPEQGGDVDGPDCVQVPHLTIHLIHNPIINRKYPNCHT